MAKLPQADGVPPQGSLGYHGFTIVEAGRTLIAYRGAVAESGTGTRRYSRDSARQVEKYLLSTGRSHLTAAEIKAVADDLAASGG